MIIPKNNLQKLRWDKGWTQRKLAQNSGVSYSLICQIENTSRPNPTIATVLLLAKALKVSTDAIFTLEDGGTMRVMSDTEEMEESRLRERIKQLEMEVARIEQLENEMERLWIIIKISNKTINKLLDENIIKKQRP